jgi:hypothetical protein
MAIRRTLAVEVGGWRPPAETGYLSPEADLLARVFDIAGPPRWVARLTCIKITASNRRNVYRTQPTHEQAYWLGQIRATDDPERAIGAHVGRSYDLAGDRVATVGLHARAWRSARYKLRKRLGLPTAVKAKTQFRRMRRYRGLP